MKDKSNLKPNRANLPLGFPKDVALIRALSLGSNFSYFRVQRLAKSRKGMLLHLHYLGFHIQSWCMVAPDNCKKKKKRINQGFHVKSNGCNVRDSVIR